ncbi:MAG: flagellar basal body rod protein FlgC [Thiobacillaceae bacterium]|nr:flagellar basal body rod protein FlgC [Thiobacillaceae bacterium]MCX7673805.1 flagellar basal body rod protein FlgC [Thiobacillaceae bacterium]MDW8323563.1 flagellar basal body rod protein FlgC [Burkholderiales bacterium]
MSVSQVYHIAATALTAQSMRLNAVASNLANADSAHASTGAPYRAKQVVFEAAPVPGAPAWAPGVRMREVVEDTRPPRLVYDPKHPLADARGYVAYANVDVVEEMVNMISAARAYQTNAEVMVTARDLLQKTLALLQV